MQDLPLAETLVDEYSDALLAISLEGDVIFWNKGAEAMFGYSRQEALGRALIDLIYLPQSVPEGLRWRELALKTGEAVFESVRRRMDGSTLYVGVSNRVARGPDGAPAYIAVSMRDVTPLKDRRDSEVLSAKFSGLLDAAPDAMVIVNEDGRILLVNAQTERLFAYSREELLGQPAELLVPERFRARHPYYRAAYTANSHPRPMGAGLELYARRKDGSEFPAEISLSPLGTEGQVLVIAAIRDVTERRQADEIRRRAEILEAQRIQEASRLKSEFVANMSHELRTPLNGIIGFAELMYDGRVGPLSEIQRDCLSDILTSSRHLLNLINSVLDLAKVEAGAIEFHPEPLDLEALIGEVLVNVRPMATEKRLRMDVELDPAVRDVVGDPAKLKQVLYNYLSNAIKFTPDGGWVAIRTQAEGVDEFRLEVRNSGIGIHPADLGWHFIEFQQLDLGTAKRYQGTGLGLALTKRLVEAQGGRVGVESESGRGSTFFAVLPLRAEAGFRTTLDPDIAVASAGEGADPAGDLPTRVGQRSSDEGQGDGGRADSGRRRPAAQPAARLDATRGRGQ